MSSRNAWVLTVMMLFPMSVVGTDGPTLTPQQREVLKVSQAWLDAFNHRDLETFARYVADDFIGSTDDGIFITKTGLLKRLATHPSEQEQRSDVRDVRVHVADDSTIINYLVSVTEGGFEQRTLSFQFRRTEFFRKNNGTWLASAAHESQLPINHRVPAKIGPETLKDYEGRYTFRPGFPATYAVEDDHLIDEWKGEKTEALPMAKDTFFEREDLGWTTFVRDKQGRVTGFVYHYADGQQATGRKIKQQGRSHENQLGTSQVPPVAAAHETDRSTTFIRRTAHGLSQQQKDVWKGEQDSFSYLNAKNLEAYMSIWDPNFVGWPDYNDRPVRKADIESATVEEFGISHSPSQPLPAPQPEAVTVLGDVAVTHYFWPEVDQTSPTIYRITHTWQKGRDGWHIIGGMSCPVPRSSESTPSGTMPDQSSKSKAATSTVPPEPDLPSAPTPQGVEARILELDRAWGQAYVMGDIDVIGRTLAPDWRGWLDTEGSDKATELAEFKAGKNRSLENIIDNARVRVYGNSAVVEARERVRFRDETGEHWITWHITDVFVKHDDRWQVVASHGSTIPNQ
jgi:ketosteroid isomerase-like protein